MIKLELELLMYWQKHGIQWIYKYKNNIKEFRGNPNLHPHELFKDISSGSMFIDIQDLANFSYKEDMYPEDIKVHIDTLIESRRESP